MEEKNRAEGVSEEMKRQERKASGMEKRRRRVECFRVKTNKHKGIMVIEQRRDEKKIASLTYDKIGTLENLEELEYNQESGEIRFSKGNQKWVSFLVFFSSIKNKR